MRKAKKTNPSPAWELLRVLEDGSCWLSQDGLKVITSEGIEADGKKWLHVSCSRKKKLPSWYDLRRVKGQFIGQEKEAYQVLPFASKYVNIHPYCLHLWSCVDGPQLPDFTRGGKSI